MALYLGKKLISRNSCIQYKASIFPLVGVLDGIVTSITIPSYIDPDDIWKLTKNRNDLASVTFPRNYSAIGNYALFGTSISSITIPSTVVRIGAYALAETSLVSITIPCSVSILEEGCLSGNIDLQTVIFEEGCNIRSLPKNFLASSSVREITIPGTVNIINSTAFSGSSLRTIRINKREGSISGAPWGATGATVIWEG